MIKHGVIIRALLYFHNGPVGLKCSFELCNYEIITPSPGRRDYDITEIDITESDVAEFDITENDITESDITETNIT